MKTGLLNGMAPGWLLGLLVAVGMPIPALLYLTGRMVYLIIEDYGN